MFFRRHPVLVIVLLAIIAIAGRIIWVQMGRKVVPGDSPVMEVEFYKHWITIRPVPGAQLGELLDMSIFAEFVPGMTFDDAKTQIGKPDNIRTEEHNTYYEYWRSRSRIEIGREEYSASNGIQVDWALYSYPKDLSYLQVLSPKIAKHIDPSAEKTGIQITNQKDEIEVFVYLRGLRVDHAIWYRN